MTAPDGKTFSYAYNRNGAVTQQINGNGTKAEYVYNSRGQLTHLVNKKSDNTVLSSFAYTLDNAGNRVAMTEADGAQTTWSYDDLYQLTREVKRNGAGAVIHDTSYTYDLAQNRTSMTNHLTSSTTTYTYHAMNQMLTAGNMSFTYDANGNTVSKVVSGQRTTYTWDYENKLTRIDYANGSSNVFTTNADGVRMTANDSGGNRRFIYDGTSIVGEQDIGSGNFIAVYDYGNGGLARQMGGAGASYYQYDGLGSTRQLTDGNQAVTDAVSYDAWGNILSSSGTTANAFKYVGQLGYYADSDSGLMLLGARYYGASGGRFLTLDPIGHAGGLNLYGYVGNNPVLRVDPQGLESEQDIINDIKKIIDRIKKILEERRRREKAAVDCIERAERNFIKCVSRTAQDTKACMKGCWARCLPSIFGGIAYPICLQVCWDACRQQGETRLRRCEEDLKDDVEDCKRQYSDVWPR